MKKRILLAIGMLVLLAILAAPLWVAIEHPEYLPTLPAVRTAEPSELLAVESATPAVIWVTSTPSAQAEFEFVLVMADMVNLRDASGNATGLSVERGQVLAISAWQADGWGEIGGPAEYEGLYIWRGCTSHSAGYGCEARP